MSARSVETMEEWIRRGGAVARSLERPVGQPAPRPDVVLARGAHGREPVDLVEEDDAGALCVPELASVQCIHDLISAGVTIQEKKDRKTSVFF